MNEGLTTRVGCLARGYINPLPRTGTEPLTLRLHVLQTELQHVIPDGTFLDLYFL